MNLSVSEKDINKVEIGDSVKITMTASSDVINGFITSVSEVGSYSSSGSYFTAVVTFDNNGKQKIGMSATYEIIIESAENVIAVPVEAIQTSDEGKYVIVVKEDGDIICYHFFDRNDLEDYLFFNTRFETPSTSRHLFGNIYQENDEYLLKLNLQVRFK